MCPKQTVESKPGLINLIVPTPDGAFVAGYSHKGLARLQFPSTDKAPPARSTGRKHLPARIGQWHTLTKMALRTALSGRRPKKLPPLDLSCGTPFQQGVWRAVQKIAPGRTLSYGELAKAIGKPRAFRAVGGACRANPIPVLIPCHRVLTTNGRLGGFSGGLAWKRSLLAREGVNPR